MAEPTAAHARDLGDYVSLVRRRWIGVVASVLVGLTLSLAYLSVAQQTYVSTSKLLVKSTGSSETSVGARTSDAINLDTEAQLVQSEPVAARAGELLASDQKPVELARRVTVSVPPNTTVLAISFQAGSAADAQDGASAFAQAYLEERQATAQESLDADITRLQGQIEEVQQQIQDTSVAIARVATARDNADRAFLMARRENLSNQLASYNAELAPLVGAVVDPGEVISEAQMPAAPVDPNPMVIIPAGLMGGLVVGLGIAVLRERFDKRIHTRADIERLFGMVPLTDLVARGRGKFARIDHDVRAFYHSLRANGPESGEVVTLVGPDAGDTAEHLSYAVASLAARSGSPTVYLNRPDSPVLETRRRLPEKGEALDLPTYEDLGVLADGEIRSTLLREELKELADTHDFLILGLPNDDPAVDLPILGRHVDVAVVVIRLGITRRDTVAEVLTDLTKSGVDRVFAVTVQLGRLGLRRRHVPAGDVFVGAQLSGPHVVPGAEDDRAPATSKAQARKDKASPREHRGAGQQQTKAVSLGSKR